MMQSFRQPKTQECFTLAAVAKWIPPPVCCDDEKSLQTEMGREVSAANIGKEITACPLLLIGEQGAITAHGGVITVRLKGVINDQQHPLIHSVRCRLKPTEKLVVPFTAPTIRSTLRWQNQVAALLDPCELFTQPVGKRLILPNQARVCTVP